MSYLYRHYVSQITPHCPQAIYNCIFLNTKAYISYLVGLYKILRLSAIIISRYKPKCFIISSDNKKCLLSASLMSIKLAISLICSTWKDDLSSCRDRHEYSRWYLSSALFSAHTYKTFPLAEIKSNVPYQFPGVGYHTGAWTGSLSGAWPDSHLSLHKDYSYPWILHKSAVLVSLNTHSTPNIDFACGYCFYLPLNHTILRL